MANCSGKCIIQQVEHKVVDYKWTSNNRDCSKPKKRHVAIAIKKVVDTYSAQIKTGCASTNCKCVKIKGKKPTEWTEWSDCVLETSYNVGDCHYNIKANIQLRTRSYNGFCLPKKLGKLSSVPLKSKR